MRVSVWMSPADRALAMPGQGWRWEGLVWAPDATVPRGRAVADLRRLREAAARLPRIALAPLPVEADPVARGWHAHWQCLAVAGGDSARAESLVAPCAEAYP